MSKSCNKSYFEFWIPILKKQYFKYRLQNDTKAILELQDSIWKNWKLTEKEKRGILNEIKGKTAKNI